MNEETNRDTGSPQAPAPGSERHGSTSYRAIRDVPSLQALAHPTRLALLEAIGLAGTMTATQASAVVGESPTACAYHLRMLAMNFSSSTFDSAPAAATTAGSSDSSSIEKPTGISRHGRSLPRPPPASSTKPSRASIRR